MKKEQLSDAIGRIDEDILRETVQLRIKQPQRRWRGWVAVAACLCVLAGSLLTLPLWQEERYEVSAPTANSTLSTTTKTTAKDGSKTTTQTTTSQTTTVTAPLKDAKILGRAAYPEMAQRPAEYGDGVAYDVWWEELRARRVAIEGHTDGMTDFYAKTMQTFLSGKTGENRVYSPLNLYFALSMLAETADGDSRNQILSLLGESDLPALRKKNHALWNGVYTDDGAVTCRFANSLWLAEGERWEYDTVTVQNLAYNYYASTYKGVMGSDVYNRVLRGWLNDQTDGLLKEQASGLEFDPDTALALASTVCFRAKWQNAFSPELTTDGVFHTADGDVTCEFLNRSGDGAAYFGDTFNAVKLFLDMGDYAMWIVLPDEGVSVDSLLSNSRLLTTLQDPGNTGLGEYILINMSIPKFDVASDRDLADGLQALGITDVFDARTADLGGILTEANEPAFLSEVQHAARVAIDEEGVTAAAYTVEMLNGTGAPMKTLDFIVNRPFLFAITGPGETLLFTGIVENPQ